MASPPSNSNFLPESPFDFSGDKWGSSSSAFSPSPSVVDFIQFIHNPYTRQRAIQIVAGAKVENDVELGPLLWKSQSTIRALLQEVTSAYGVLSTSMMTDKISTRVCNALAVLQKVAGHPDTRSLFIKANITAYVYPYLNVIENDRCHDFIRSTSLGLIGSLVKNVDDDAVIFLLKSEVFPYCLRCMEVGSQLSKTVATFVVYNIIMHDQGLSYCGTYAERFFAITKVLARMVDQLPIEQPSKLLLSYIICCYLRLSESPRACDGLIATLPARLKDNSLYILLHDDSRAKASLKQLLHNVAAGHQSKVQPAEKLFAKMSRR